ncbi:DUF6580 family putative transport protein [Vulcaniibacterium tengchongense]|uniref:Rod shape-determining protein MreD n=1 Tax=Vulcaniibacterium tengchongense TaxID=1273429 RepID=A0A3N4UXP7_9GAMM|nr:DUF6580 family putative transport protein [Vulcaniibacterium tengchongense]RPE75492.1 hypothetical protein EDC50_2937 [Vulcaniibacterium tengchongense]
MNRPASDSLLAPGPLVLAAMIAAAALSRLLPHPPNFSPVEAMALFAGAHFASRRWAFAVPLLGMFLSDLALAAINGGLYATWFGNGGIWMVYLCIALSTALGLNLRGKAGGGRVLGYSLLGSVLFFVVTNFGAWLFQPLPTYPMTAAGLAAAYVAGIPFFQWTVLGTLTYAALLFGGFALLRRHVPALRPQTV